MHGKPNRTGRRAMNAMSLMAWNGNVVAGFQFDKLAAVKLQSGRAAKNHDPLGFGLVIPEAGRTLMRLGNDALDPHGGSFKQLLKLFLAMDHPYSGKNVSVVNYHQATSSLRASPSPTHMEESESLAQCPLRRIAGTSTIRTSPRPGGFSTAIPSACTISPIVTSPKRWALSRDEGRSSAIL